MKDFLLDKDGDILFINGDIAIVEDEEELAQSVRIILGARLEEFELDKSLGLFTGNLYGKHKNLSYLKKDIVEAILTQESRISSVNEVLFSLDKENRRLSIQVDMTGSNGGLSVEVLVDA